MPDEASKTTEPPWPPEPIITVNGTTLTVAQAMTVRVALQSMALSLQDNGLGEDEIGRGIATGYLAAICSINWLMKL